MLVFTFDSSFFSSKIPLELQSREAARKRIETVEEGPSANVGSQENCTSVSARVFMVAECWVLWVVCMLSSAVTLGGFWETKIKKIKYILLFKNPFLTALWCPYTVIS